MQRVVCSMPTHLPHSALRCASVRSTTQQGAATKTNVVHVRQQRRQVVGHHAVDDGDVFLQALHRAHVVGWCNRLRQARQDPERRLLGKVAQNETGQQVHSLAVSAQANANTGAHVNNIAASAAIAVEAAEAASASQEQVWCEHAAAGRANNPTCRTTVL